MVGGGEGGGDTMGGGGGRGRNPGNWSIYIYIFNLYGFISRDLRKNVQKESAYLPSLSYSAYTQSHVSTAATLSQGAVGFESSSSLGLETWANNCFWESSPSQTLHKLGLLKFFFFFFLSALQKDIFVFVFCLHICSRLLKRIQDNVLLVGDSCRGRSSIMSTFAYFCTQKTRMWSCPKQGHVWLELTQCVNKKNLKPFLYKLSASQIRYYGKCPAWISNQRGVPLLATTDVDTAWEPKQQNQCVHILRRNKYLNLWWRVKAILGFWGHNTDTISICQKHSAGEKRKPKQSIYSNWYHGG